MNISALQIITAALVVGTTVALFMVRQNYKVAMSERRMIRMMERVGLHSAIISSSEPGSVLEYAIGASTIKIRKRCQACSIVDECERWLAGKEDGDMVLCPIAKEIRALKIVCDDVSNNRHTGAM